MARSRHADFYRADSWPALFTRRQVKNNEMPVYKAPGTIVVFPDAADEAFPVEFTDYRQIECSGTLSE